MTRLSDLIWPFVDSRDAIAAGALKQQNGDDELLAAADSAVTPTVRAEEAQLDEEDQATLVEERLYTEGQDFVLASSVEEITDAILNWKGDEIFHELAIALLEKYTNLEEVQLRFSGVGTETWRRSGHHLVYVDKTTSRDRQKIAHCAHWREPADGLFRN